MKSFFFVLLTLFLVETVSAHYGPRGLLGGTITCATHHNGLVYLGTENAGVYESVNSQLVSWRGRSVGLKSGKIAAITHSGTELYVATADSGVFIYNGFVGSDRFWNKRNTGLTNLNMLSIVAVDTNTLLVGTNGGGLFMTANKGVSWTAVNNSFFNNRSITALVKAGNRLVALVDNAGVYVSDNNGSTWSSLNDANTLNKMHSKFLNYNASTDQLMVYNHDGLFVLDTASTRVSPVYVAAQTGLPSGTSIKNISNNGNNWYLATGSGVFTTASSGINWVAANTGLPTTNVGVVVAMTNDLFVGTHKRGMFKTSAASINWVDNNTGMTNIITYSVTGRGDSVVVTATEYGIVFSSNLGNNPVLRNTGLTDSLNVNDVEFGENLLFAATRNGGIFVSSNMAQTWTARNGGLSNLHIKRIIYANARVYAIDSAGKVYQSDLNGNTWTQITTGLPTAAVASSLAFYANWMIVGTMGNGVYIKHRDSSTWQAFNGGLSNLNVTAVAASAGKFYAGTDGSGVFTSDISTAAWTATSPISIPHFNNVPINPNRIQYLATFAGYVMASYQGGVVATEDGGAFWGPAGNQHHLPSYTNIRKISFITTRILVSTDDNSMMSNSAAELAFIDTILTVSQASVDAPVTGMISYHNITSNIRWQVTAADAWVTVSVDSGFRNRPISLDIAPNMGGPRSSTVTLTGGNVTRSIVINQAGVVGLVDVLAEQVKVYPNPSKGSFVVEFGQYPAEQISLFDAMGRRIKTYSLDQQPQFQVQEELIPGIYFLEFQAGRDKVVKKLMVD